MCAPSALFRAEAADFELLRTLGTVSYAVERGAEQTLTWRGGDDGSVPDSISVLGGGAGDASASSGGGGGDAVIKLYAGKVVGWGDGGERTSNAVPDVLLKEYVNAAAATMADAEVEAYMKLYADPEDSTIAQLPDGIPVGTPFDPASLPVVPLVAFFASKPVGNPGAGAGESGARGSLWTVQAWGPGGLARLSEYPARRQETKEATFWPPVQRVRDNGLGPRQRYVRNAANGVLAALAAVHSRGIAHNAVDASAFQVSTSVDQKADDLEVRLMNFGFAGRLTEESQSRDLRAGAVVIAELVFSALSLSGPSDRTTAPALERLFEQVFGLDVTQAREYCAQETEWIAAVEFWDYRDRQGDGWSLLADMWRGDCTAEELLARAEAVETPYD